MCGRVKRDTLGYDRRKRHLPAPASRLHDVPLFGVLDEGSSFPSGSWSELHQPAHGTWPACDVVIAPGDALSRPLKLRPDANKSQDPNTTKTANDQTNQSRSLDPWHTQA